MRWRTCPRRSASLRPRRDAGWWWTAFLLLLGPVAIGRLDAVVAPLVMLALVAARGPGRTALAAVLLTAGAWIKVAPGALLVPLAAASRRPAAHWRAFANLSTPA